MANEKEPGAGPEKARGAGAEPAEAKVMLAADFGKFYAVVSRDKRGRVEYRRPVRAEMTLYKDLGHIYTVGERSSITAAGYVHLNKVPSISILSPQQLIVDGHPVPNPMIERESKTKAITAVNIRKVGIGYSPAGNLVVVDKTLFYNVYTYLIQSVQKKMSTKATDVAVYGVVDKKPEGASWYFLQTEGTLGIWINYQAPAIIECLEEHTQRQRFGDRIAQKIVERNILKDHPAIGQTQVYAQNVGGRVRAVVTVYGWRTETTPADLSDIVHQLEAGDATKDFEVKAETVPAATAEEEKAEFEAVAEEEAEASPAEPASLFGKEAK